MLPGFHITLLVIVFVCPVFINVTIGISLLITITLDTTVKTFPVQLPAISGNPAIVISV
jgi:hypothetical protein